MMIIIIPLTFSLLLAVFFLFLFIRSGKQHQFDDLDSPSIRILYDESERPYVDENNLKHI
ncbi:MAG: cbb3-type cytochrome oxidase assembly protein CcoS [Bacteroidia bacterium]|nr:cbb3-type cytochrome oxidase assembly protein CcoS [Bacteroidia bacterium]